MKYQGFGKVLFELLKNIFKKRSLCYVIYAVSQQQIFKLTAPSVSLLYVIAVFDLFVVKLTCTFYFIHTA